MCPRELGTAITPDKRRVSELSSRYFPVYSALCQQQQFRRLSPHPSARPPEYLYEFSLQWSQVLHLLCAQFSEREASRVDFVLLCEGLLIKTTGENITGPAGGTQKEL